MFEGADVSDGDAAQVTATDGTKFYGLHVVGPAEGTQAAGPMVGDAGARKQYVIAIDGVRFGPGDDQLDDTDAMGAMCPVNADKKTGDTSTLRILDVDRRTGALRTFDQQVTYR
jgi:hypothetical protein